MNDIPSTPPFPSLSPSALIDVIGAGQSLTIGLLTIALLAVERYDTGFSISAALEVAPVHPMAPRFVRRTLVSDAQIKPDTLIKPLDSTDPVELGDGWTGHVPPCYPRIQWHVAADGETLSPIYPGAENGENSVFRETMRAAHPLPRSVRQLAVEIADVEWQRTIPQAGSGPISHRDFGPWRFDIDLPPMTPFDLYPENGRQPLGKMKGGSAKVDYGLQLFRVTKLHSCAYCGLDLTGSYEHWLHLQVDHVVPTSIAKSAGLPPEWVNDLFNLVLCCSACNAFDNRFNWNVVAPTADWTVDAFCDLRDQIFIARKRSILKRHMSERALYRSHWLRTS